MAGHQKRISAPTSWAITRKTHKWAVKPVPGPHSKKRCVPLAIVLRDMLKLGDNIKEIRYMLDSKQIIVDGKVIRDHKFPIGIFDVVSISAIKTHYRVLLDPRGRFTLHKIKDSNVKLCRINNKTVVRGGMVQLNLHDGSNIIGSNEYRSGDSVVLKLPERKIVKRLEYKPGNLVMVVGGRHSGEIGTIKELIEVRSSRPNMVTVKSDKEFETTKDYVFVIGTEKPDIDLEVRK
ncbi:MAG: 30S ribosomal protein S4e [Methanosarcinales archaeon Met12]|nr:MAG: 30S ribosomal protein S4e [Methanosarcinales archaeon Met12]